MTSKITPLMVYTTFPDITSAKRVGGELVDMGLVACVNILPGMVSIYSWEGKRETADEVVMIVKTQKTLADSVIREVTQRHPYDTPAVLSWEITGGAQAYIDWIEEMTCSGGPRPSQ